VSAPASTQLALGARVPPRPRTEYPTGQPAQQPRQPGNRRAVLANYVLAIAAAINGPVVQHGCMLRTRPLPALVIVIGLNGALAAAKYHERTSYHLFHTRVLARRWRTSARSTTPNASRLSRLRLHQLRAGLTSGGAPNDDCQVPGLLRTGTFSRTGTSAASKSRAFPARPAMSRRSSGADSREIKTGYLAASPRAARAERTWLTMISVMMAIENQSP